MKIDLTSLRKALVSLNRAIDRSRGAPGDEELRDAVIQRFEYSMDLSWKMAQRVMKAEGANEADLRTKRDLFREGAKAGIFDDPERWFAWLEARNETSHTYSAGVAERVYQKAQEFAPAAGLLLERLEARTGA